jgi:transposase, IS5 family
VAGLNEALLIKVASQKLVRTDKFGPIPRWWKPRWPIRPTRDCWPNPSVVAPRRSSGFRLPAGDPYPRVRDRSRSAGQRARSIVAKLRRCGAAAREEGQAAVLRITGELADVAEAAMADAQAVLRNARRGLRTATGNRRGRFHRAVNDLHTLLERTGQVVSQTRSRLAGVMPDSASRIVSFHDVDATRAPNIRRCGSPSDWSTPASRHRPVVSGIASIMPSPRTCGRP